MWAPPYDRSMIKRERRRFRSSNPTLALTYQLDVARRAADADAMVLSDEHGMCVAQAGDADSCWEVAARLPILSRKAGDFEGVLLDAGRQIMVAMRRVMVSGTELYLAILGATESRVTPVMDRSAAGVARILA